MVRVAEDRIKGSLGTTPSDALVFILDLLPEKLKGVKIATLGAIRLRKRFYGAGLCLVSASINPT